MFHVCHTLDGPMYALESENAKSHVFEMPPKRSCLSGVRDKYFYRQSINLGTVCRYMDFRVCKITDFVCVYSRGVYKQENRMSVF